MKARRKPGFFVSLYNHELQLYARKGIGLQQSGVWWLATIAAKCRRIRQDSRYPGFKTDHQGAWIEILQVLSHFHR